MSEVHGTVTLNPNAPTVDGTVTLKQAALKLGPSVQGGISDLNGSISFANGVGVVEPTSFALGSAHASLEGRVDSLSPLRASYALKADSVRLAQILASRPNSDVVNGLDVNGTANGEISSPRLSATIRSTDGSLRKCCVQQSRSDGGILQPPRVGAPAQRRRVRRLDFGRRRCSIRRGADLRHHARDEKSEYRRGHCARKISRLPRPCAAF